MRDKMRSIWTGTIGAGPLVIPMKLGNAVSDDKLPLHQVRRADGSRIEYKRVAKADGQEVAWADLTRGYETANGQVVVLEDADFELAYGGKNREAKILLFAPLDTLPRVAHEGSYLVEPGKGGERAYALLAKAMTRTGKAAVVSFAMRQRESLAALYPNGNGYLMLERLQWAADVRKPDFTVPAGSTEAEIELAENLIGLMTKPFDWAEYRDESQEKLEKVIQGKIEGGQVLGIAAAPGSNPAPVDLAEVLRASVEQAKAAAAPVPAPRARRPRARKTTEKATEAAA